MSNLLDNEKTVIALFDAAEAAKRVFGAPGDYGYGTSKGDALLSLSRALVEAHPLIVALKGLAAVRNATAAE